VSHIEYQNQIRKGILETLKAEDCIGSLNFWKGSLYGLLLMSKDSHGTLKTFLEENYSQIALQQMGNEADNETQLTWGRGDRYVIY